MAGSKKSAPKTAEPTPEDLPEESVSEDHPVEPVIADPPVEANPDGQVEPGVEQPKTADEAPEVAPNAAPVESNEPTPWRVETYGDGVQYGWRLCAANGNIIRESGTFFDSVEAAIADAERSGDTGTAVFLDRNVSGTTLRGWR